MFRFAKKILCLGVLACGLQTSFSFSLLGPFEVWQVTSIGLNLPTDIGGPKNISEEYRINSPIITYAFDPSFLDYFGPNGVKAVEQAISILNRLPAASKASPSLSEFLTSDAVVFQGNAAALNLFDLKSEALSLLIEHMGLMGETHVFDLRQRQPVPNSPACTFSYTTIIRNFDPVTLAPSREVNGTRYTYQIIDTCPNPLGGDASEVLLDPTDIPFSAVASFSDSTFIGSFFIGISRDDFGGLRYLYKKSNLNQEPLPTNAFPVLAGGAFQPVDNFTNNFSTNGIAVRGGVEKIQYVRVNYVDDFGTQFTPRVVDYSIPVRNGSKVATQRIRRLVVRPDIVFAAADLAPPDPAQVPGPIPAARRSQNIFANSGFPNSVGTTPPSGPGIITPQTEIIFNKLGPYIINQTPLFLDEAASLGAGFVWGSFDGTTNLPIVYPRGTSYQDIENLVLGFPN